jgi:hypothetical protein
MSQWWRPPHGSRPRQFQRVGARADGTRSDPEDRCRVLPMVNTYAIRCRLRHKSRRRDRMMGQFSRNVFARRIFSSVEENFAKTSSRPSSTHSFRAYIWRKWTRVSRCHSWTSIILSVAALNGWQHPSQTPTKQGPGTRYAEEGRNSRPRESAAYR